MAFLVVLFLLVVRTVSTAQPNVVIFLVDDLGVGDIGCFGNDTIKTPNIDKLAREGARLTHNLAPESVCTPSRAAFLTGRYAIRSGLAANRERSRMFLFVSVPGGLPQNETTFAEVLQDAGYATGNLSTLDSYYNDYFQFPVFLREREGKNMKEYKLKIGKRVEMKSQL